MAPEYWFGLGLLCLKMHSSLGSASGGLKVMGLEREKGGILQNIPGLSVNKLDR